MRLSLNAMKRLDDTPSWEWPDSTGRALLEVLRDHSAGEKELLLAAELAGDSSVVDDDLVGALLAILRGDASEQVVGQAAISLGPVLELGDTEGFDDHDSVSISEHVFHEIQETMRALYQDANVPKLVRRRILEASVRAPLDWHQGAIRDAYDSGDEEWKLTAVFSMRHVRGFDEQILESLSNKNPEIHAEAVRAAGAWSIDAAWRHVVDLVTAEDTDRAVFLAAITAVGDIRPKEAPEVLQHLEDSEDPAIAEAVLDATTMTGARGEEDDPLDEDEEPDSFS
jgi:hypothetical protein